MAVADQKRTESNPWQTAQRQFDDAAEILKLDHGLRRILREVQREFTCHFPVQLDDGHVQNFTGYRVDVGGSLGRADATGRGVMICTLAALETMGLKPFNQRVVVQGFGNVGSVSARLLEEAGCTVVAVSEDYGGIYNPLGLPVRKLFEYRASEGTLKGFPGAELVSNEDLLKIECDVLVPAALENQITSRNAGDIHARLIVEGANGPTTPEADEILRK